MLRDEGFDLLERRARDRLVATQHVRHQRLADADLRGGLASEERTMLQNPLDDLDDELVRDHHLDGDRCLVHDEGPPQAARERGDIFGASQRTSHDILLGQN